MKGVSRRARGFFGGVALVSVLCVSGAGLARAAKDEKYVCPPCGHDCLETTFDAPGACGECGMQLVELSSLQDRPPMRHADPEDRKRVAILLFDGVQIIDYTGPWEILGQAGYEVFTVARAEAPITTVFGMKVQPDYTLGDHPRPDILLVPGGQVLSVQNDPRVQAWVRQTAATSEIVLSVCNGSFILAKSGLLQGLRATATRPLVAGLANAAPGITPVHGVRYVDTGKIVTSGGLSAGMDATLHVVARLESPERARSIARGLEYAWDRDAPAECQPCERADLSHPGSPVD